MTREAIELLSRDLLLSLAHEHLDGLPNLSIAPDIAPRKLRRARSIHELHLGAGEPILVLFDSTVLGSGEDGFVATPSQICWKNFLEYPRRVRWDELAQTAVEAHGRHVEIARGQVEVPSIAGGPERVRAFLLACAVRAPVSATPYREPAQPRDVLTVEQLIVQTARRALGELSWVHYRPSIPPKMVAAARIVHERHLAASEDILVLYDDTLFGSGNDGVVLTERGLCWRNFWGAAESLAWSELDPDLVVADGDLLFLNGDPDAAHSRKLDLRMRPGVARRVAGALQEIARAARQAG